MILSNKQSRMLGIKQNLDLREIILNNEGYYKFNFNSIKFLFNKLKNNIFYK